MQDSAKLQGEHPLKEDLDKKDGSFFYNLVRHNTWNWTWQNNITKFIL
jgi:hypothetical protein